MVTRIKKAIQNSKHKASFNKRQTHRIKKKQRAGEVEQKQFVDKKKRREEKMRQKGEEVKDNEEMEIDDELISSDSDLEKELAEDQAATDPDKLDESVFQQYTTGELDLPEEEDEDDSSQEERDMEGDEANDSELEEYYQELGIEPIEMKKEKKVDEEALYKKKKKKEAKK